ncbi:alpha/beta hydrolase [Methylibium sp.]|uniref:alpha/beta hydrolase n=1 Tax=Methylibium sp. TaxID=2067992 RepID=UPI003D13E91E
MSKLYRQFTTQAEIDAQYDVERSVPDFMVYARHYIEESRATRTRLRCELDIPYGPTRAETLDIFPAAEPNAPVFVFFHGGYWRMLTSKEFSCVALGLNQLGITTVVVNYELLPKVSLDEITRQSRSAVAWVLRNIQHHGGDPKRVVVGGHSAGGHLTAMLAQTQWSEDYGLAPDPMAGAVMVSGLFDLHPLRYSCMQPQLQFDDGVIQRNSPLFQVRASATPALVTWGGDEPDEFRRQSDAYLAAWKEAGNAAKRLEQPGANHFTAIYGFEDAKSPLCQWVLQAANTPRS